MSIAVFVFLSMIVAGKAMSLSYENEELSKKLDNVESSSLDLRFSSMNKVTYYKKINKVYHARWLKKKRESNYRKRALDNVKNRVYYNPMSNELVVLSDLKFVGYITKGEINE